MEPKNEKDTRLLGLDFARGCAILGMIVVNFKTSMAYGKEGPQWLLTLTGLLEGRAAATFVILAGMGLSLLSHRARTSGDNSELARNRRLLLNRAFFLLVGGLIFTVLWPADILHYYGIYIAIGAFLLAASDRKLLLLAALFTLVFPICLVLFDYERGWNLADLSYSGFWTYQGLLRNLFFNGFHPVFPWTAFLLLGMVLGRFNLRDPKTRKRLLLGGALLAFLSETGSWLLVKLGAAVMGPELARALLSTSMMPPMPLYIFAGSGTAVVVICVCIQFTERFYNGVLVRVLVPTGQLALTHYMGHVLVGFGVLSLVGRLEEQTFVFSIQSALVYCLITLAFSVLWRKHFSRGPIEACMRWITDPKREPG